VTPDAKTAKALRDAQYGLLTAVAAEADVSLATVSKVVHRRRDVAKATRAKIEALLDSHGYVRPWESATRRPRQVLAVFPRACRLEIASFIAHLSTGQARELTTARNPCDAMPAWHWRRYLG